MLRLILAQRILRNVVQGRRKGTFQGGFLKEEEGSTLNHDSSYGISLILGFLVNRCEVFLSLGAKVLRGKSLRCAEMVSGVAGNVLQSLIKIKVIFWARCLRQIWEEYSH